MRTAGTTRIAHNVRYNLKSMCGLAGHLSSMRIATNPSIEAIEILLPHTPTFVIATPVAIDYNRIIPYNSQPALPAMLINTLAAALVSMVAANPDVVVVCPAPFQAELKPWTALRESQGHVVEVISPQETVEGTRSAIGAVAKSGKLRFVVLVGDTPAVNQAEPGPSDVQIPVDYVKAKVNVLWGSTPYIATDNSYADLDGDRIPDVALGRLSADTPEELRRIIAKIIRYETSHDFGPWRRQVNFVAGVGHFGAVADTVLESATRYLIVSRIPVAYAITMTHAGWHSPYFPDPRRFREMTMERLNEGSLFWVYIGHGYFRHLGRVRLEDNRYPVLTNGDIPHLECQTGLPIALFLACYVGAFDAPEDCLAERMLSTEGGPVAVIAGSRVTMPYAMAILGQAMLDEFFAQRRNTLGEMLLNVKRAMVAEPDKNDRRRQMIDAVAALISPAADKLDEERREHLELFNLIGDPLLTLRHPKPIELGVSPTATAGETVTISGESPFAGTAVLELVARRDRLTFPFQSRRKAPKTEKDFAEAQETYVKANSRCLLKQSFPIEAGKFTRTITVPQDASGPFYARVFIQGDEDYALGGREIRISQAPAGTMRF